MRLLNRTILSFLIYSIVVLLVATPLFYFLIDRIFIKEVDEALLTQKKEIQIRMQNKKSESELKDWEDLDGEVRISAYNGSGFADSIYYITQYDSVRKEVEPYRVLSTVITINQKPYKLVARISMVESEDLIEAVAFTQAISLFILLTGLLIINWRLSKRIWKPFYDTLEKLKKFDVESTLHLNLSHSSVKEFEDLNFAINQLTERDYKAYLNQKEFTENAAHEMQTPLAVFQSKLELLMQTNPSEDQAKLMESLADATSRLARLNRALLLLSKIDSPQFIDTEAMNLGELTVKLTNLFRQEAEGKEIQIKIDTKSNLQVDFNAALMDILISNLISNSIRHNSGDDIQITIAERYWEISNPGEPVSVPPDKIFNRFQKGRSGHSSTGLGLAIAKKICDTTGLGIRYEYRAGRHFFSVYF